MYASNYDGREEEAEEVVYREVKGLRAWRADSGTELTVELPRLSSDACAAKWAGSRSGGEKTRMLIVASKDGCISAFQ